MNEQSLLKILSAPGAIVVLMLWLNSRIAHVETCLEVIARERGIELPKRKTPRLIKSMLPVLSAALMLFSTGCASVTQTATNPDGSKIESRVTAFWPATSALDKGNVKATKTTMGIGTEGAAGEGGGTNLVSALSELRQILQTLAPH